MIFSVIWLVIFIPIRVIITVFGCAMIILAYMYMYVNLYTCINKIISKQQQKNHRDHPPT